MKFWHSIKNNINRRIEADRVKGNEPLKKEEELSIKTLMNGQLLLASLSKVSYLLIILFFITVYYINNGFQYESLVKTNNELKDQQLDLRTTELVNIRRFKDVSSRSAILKKISELGINLKASDTPPIVISE